MFKRLWAWMGPFTVDCCSCDSGTQSRDLSYLVFLMLYYTFSVAKGAMHSSTTGVQIF